MPVTSKLFCFVPFVLSMILPATPISQAGPMPLQPVAEKPRPSVEVEVKYIDDSTMKLRLLDEKIELVTKHGVLLVAVADIRRIDFANRIPVEIAEKVLQAIARLNHSDFQIREAATEELKGYRERAYPFVQRALKADDPEVTRRADEVVKFIQARVPAAQLEARETDVVHTDDSKITGRLTAESFRVTTFQFGELHLKLADLKSLRSAAAIAVEATSVAPPAPGNLSSFQQQWGKELAYTITGFTPTPGVNPNLWGTDQYTLDSDLSAAVVHAGLAKPGEKVTIHVRIIRPPPQFVSSFRNNVNSTAYGNYAPGAYEFVRR